jgi:hypothetical protein
MGLLEPDAGHRRGDGKVDLARSGPADRGHNSIRPSRGFRYQALDRSFPADPSVDDDGLVIDYPTLFERVES